MTGKSRGQGLRRAWNWGLPMVLIPVAVVLNPSEDRHLAVLRSALAEKQAVAATFPEAERADPQVQFTSLGVLSFTRRDHTVTTLGAFGKVVAVARRWRTVEP